MARHDHLQLLRLPEKMERRKHGGGVAPDRPQKKHGPKLSSELTDAITEQRKQRPPEFVDPSLILRVRMSGMTMEQDWTALGLTLLASDDDKTLVLFASSDEMIEFRARLKAYEGEVPAGQKAPRYAGFINRIEDIGTVEPRDRIGIRLREEGIVEPEEILADQSYVFDVELWDIGSRDLRSRKIKEIVDYIEIQNGEVFDQYIGPSISMVRASMTGDVTRVLLTVPEIALVDLPPVPDVGTADHVELTITDLPNVEPVDDDAPIVGVIDSGINLHPLLEDVIVDAIGIPEELGSADVWGHGTRVGGISVFGDLRGQLDAGALTKGVRLVSAKVITDEGQFYERRLIPGQMRDALTRLNEDYGCRIFVISLGDIRRSNDDGRVGPWAATLDELARELDILIILPSGNHPPPSGTRLEQAVTNYPHYLLENANRLCEPAGAINILTVGSLANGEGVGPEHAEDANIQTITRALEPSPFTRRGPGVGGAKKPDLVDIGGTMVFDAVTASLRRGPDLPSAGCAYSPSPLSGAALYQQIGHFLRRTSSRV